MQTARHFSDYFLGRRQVGFMTCTRAVVITAMLALAVVTALAQTNLATSSSTAIGLAIQTQDKATTVPTQESKTSDTKADGDYVGSDTCITCHEDQSRR